MYQKIIILINVLKDTYYINQIWIKGMNPKCFRLLRSKIKQDLQGANIWMTFLKWQIYG